MIRSLRLLDTNLQARRNLDPQPDGAGSCVVDLQGPSTAAYQLSESVAKSRTTCRGRSYKRKDRPGTQYGCETITCASALRDAARVGVAVLAFAFDDAKDSLYSFF